ncbi:M23 family metallopeptidase [Rhizobium sp. ARZ01]|uniref:M23 family metallopeptidase n=1 Tax=Rhizobium sp. ARZ01 TaxID=2769313 RepID=UPI0032B1BCEA
MAAHPESRVFGKREQQHIIILASGDKVRHMTVRPWMTAVAFCFAGMFTVGYLAATSYLVLRDGLIGATMARQARMQHDYEDRISALRAQVDRVTSRQLLDQQVVEEKVEKLLEQQMALTERNGKLDTLLNRAGSAGIADPVLEEPVEEVEPLAYGRRADAAAGLKAIDRVLGRETAGAATRQASIAPLAYAAPGESVADRADRMFSNVTLSLKNVERQQVSRIQSLTNGASEMADAIESILAHTGIEIEVPPVVDDASAIGGPFVEPLSSNIFEYSLGELDTALNRLDSMRSTARKLPFANPSPGSDVTSRFGNRTDPFLGRLALHAGIDFRLPVGSEVRATGSGTVVTASRNGGYGNLVEIDHGDGLTTRYAHLSRILAKVGDTVDSGDIVGLSGSTGRSTGPHLHYEVRRNGRASDPARFLAAGAKLSSYMN